MHSEKFNAIHGSTYIVPIEAIPACGGDVNFPFYMLVHVNSPL